MLKQVRTTLLLLGVRNSHGLVHLLKWGAGKGPDPAVSRAGPKRSLGYLDTCMRSEQVAGGHCWDSLWGQKQMVTCLCQTPSSLGMVLEWSPAQPLTLGWDMVGVSPSFREFPSLQFIGSQQVPGKVPPLFPPIFFCVHNPVQRLHLPAVG